MLLKHHLNKLITTPGRCGAYPHRIEAHPLSGRRVQDGCSPETDRSGRSEAETGGRRGVEDRPGRGGQGGDLQRGCEASEVNETRSLHAPVSRNLGDK